MSVISEETIRGANTLYIDFSSHISSSHAFDGLFKPVDKSPINGLIAKAKKGIARGCPCVVPPSECEVLAPRKSLEGFSLLA